MLSALISVFAVLLLLLLSEFLWRAKLLNTEISRKLVHIGTGVFVAFWPLFMSWGYIELISLAFIVVIIISSKINIFKSIHSVKRTTWGEFIYAIVLALLAFTIHTNWIFAAAVLHLSLADGLAAVIGLHHKKRIKYSVFGYEKSLVGSLAFLVTSILIVGLVGIRWGHASWTVLLWLPVTATLAENLGVRGMDNLFVPLVVTLGLRFF